MALRQENNKGTKDGLTARERISRAKMQLYRSYPFYSYLVENMNFIQDDTVPSIGVNARGDCYYNEEWINSLTICAVFGRTESIIPNELLGVLAHEVLHLSFLHCTRGKNRTITINGGTLWNVAVDMIVNAILVKERMMLPKDGILPLPVTQTNLEEDNFIVYGIEVKGVLSLSAEEIYEILKNALKQKMKEQKQKGQGEGEEEGNENAIYVSGLDEEGTKGFDSHDRFNETKDEIEGQEGEGKEGQEKPKPKDWSRLAKDAYNYSKLQGKEPAEDAPRIGVDVGLNVMAATSEGELLGTSLKPKFNVLYSKVRDLRANRQRQNFKENSPRLDCLESKLTGMVKTMAGECSNKLVRKHPGAIFVVEDLDLRGCCGAKRFAYRALHHSLETKAPCLVVNPAYSSQMCPSCGYVSRKNRSGIEFHCRSCGRISHADVVGGINLLGRSEDKQVGLDDHPSAVKTILRERYLHRRNSSSRGTQALVPSSLKLTTEVFSKEKVGTVSNQVVL